jgi:hypothetical protein
MLCIVLVNKPLPYAHIVLVNKLLPYAHILLCIKC